MASTLHIFFLILSFPNLIIDLLSLLFFGNPFIAFLFPLEIKRDQIMKPFKHSKVPNRFSSLFTIYPYYLP